MKYKLMTGILSLFSFLAVSQQNGGGIKKLPQMYSNILILNQGYFQDVEKWKVVVYEETIVWIQNQPNYQINAVDSTEILGGFYMKLDTTYLNGSGVYYISTYGMDSTNAIIVQDEYLPVGDGPHGSLPCTAKCIGLTYAYQLNLNVAPNGGSSKITVQSTTPSTPGQYYYYEWFSPAAFSGLTSADNDYYLARFDLPYYDNGMSIIRLTGVPSSAGYKNSSFATLDGTIYGVSKFLGPWVGPIMESNTFSGGETHCGQNLGFGISQVNLNTSTFQGRDNLSCDGSSVHFYNTEDPPTGGGSMASDGAIAECLVNTLFTVDTSTYEDQMNIYLYIDQLGNCPDPSLNPNSPISWPAHVECMILTPMRDTIVQENEIIYLHYDSLFSSNGEFTGVPLYITRGLYSVQTVFTDYSFRFDFFEAQDNFTSILPLSEFLEVNIYPVPIQGNEFSMDFKSYAKLRFTYSMRNTSADLIYSNVYEVDKDDTETVHVQIQNLPSGTYFNRFDFSDGSYFVIQTIKP